MTFKEVARLAAQAAGKPEAANRVVLYDPAAKKVLGGWERMCMYVCNVCVCNV